jgi:Zn-dependent protease with chaperone function
VDFYTEQDNARRKTRWLVLLFMFAVLLLIGISNLLIGALVYYMGVSPQPGMPVDTIEAMFLWFTWQRFTWVSAAVMSTVCLVILFKWVQLASGGKGVAERLGGQRILPNTNDPDQRRCLNVVEEMSLAAGLPVPPVYLLAEERGINAFAAGISPGDAVIGITQGSLNNFSREQMQGVIAHEFSHILNGDMRLNIRLAAMLKGITFISDIGELVVRGTSRRRHTSIGGGSSFGGGTSIGGGTSGRSSKSAQILLIGIALWLLGWLGGLFAGFIKAAVSRQRELLADASAVQFTRNPGGVADALKVIGGYVPGTLIVEARAGELSHIFFGQISSTLWQFFATHPPLPERIRRIEPGWDGEYIKNDRETSYEGLPQDQVRRQKERRAAATATAAILAGAVLGKDAGVLVENAAADAEFADVGEPATGKISEQLAEQARDPLGANAIAYGVMMSRDPAEREAQLQLVAATGVRGMEATVRQLLGELQTLSAEWRLPLLEMSLPALKCMSLEQYRQFKDTLLKITRTDERVDLYEWCMFQVIRHYLDPEFVQVKPSKPRHRKPAHVRQQLRTVISVLAWRGHTDESEREAAFARGVESVGLHKLRLRPIAECSVVEFSQAVTSLADCYPLLKPRLLKGMALCAAHDGRLTAEECEILVAVAAVMDCPVPASVRRDSVNPAGPA